MVTVGNHEYDHLSQVIIQLESPQSALGTTFTATPSRFGSKISQWDASSTHLIAAPPGILCNYEEPTEEQIREGLKHFDGRIVIVHAADDCKASLLVRFLFSFSS